MKYYKSLKLDKKIVDIEKKFVISTNKCKKTMKETLNAFAIYSGTPDIRLVPKTALFSPEFNTFRNKRKSKYDQNIFQRAKAKKLNEEGEKQNNIGKRVSFQGDEKYSNFNIKKPSNNNLSTSINDQQPESGNIWELLGKNIYKKNIFLPFRFST